MRMNPLLRWLAAASVGLACGCDGADTGTVPPAPTAPPVPSEPAAPTPEPTPLPTAEPADTADASSGDAEAGKVQYALFCASCHGETGCGDGALSATLEPKPASHCDGNIMNVLTDAHLFRVIEDGGPSVGKSPQMAAWGGTLDEGQIWDVVAFVRTLADPPYQAP